MEGESAAFASESKSWEVIFGEGVRDIDEGEGSVWREEADFEKISYIAKGGGKLGVVKGEWVGRGGFGVLNDYLARCRADVDDCAIVRELEGIVVGSAEKFEDAFELFFVERGGPGAGWVAVGAKDVSETVDEGFWGDGKVLENGGFWIRFENGLDVGFVATKGVQGEAKGGIGEVSGVEGGHLSLLVKSVERK